MLIKPINKIRKIRKKTKEALDPDIAERAAVLANLKKQIALAKVNAQRAATIKAQDKIKEVKNDKKKFLFEYDFIFNSFSYNQLIANDVADMSGISEAAGESAAAAASQLSNDTGAITSNISSVTEALGAATTEVGAKLDVSIAQAQAAMDFATQSIEAGNLTAAVQTMSLVESVADMALSSVPNPTALDMSGISFDDFSADEMAALSSIAGTMGVGKVMAVKKWLGKWQLLNKQVLTQRNDGTIRCSRNWNWNCNGRFSKSRNGKYGSSFWCS